MIAVVHDGVLVGIVPIEDLLAADDDVTAERIMDGDPPRIAPGADQEVAAWRAVQHRESGLAVVDADGMFLGLIPADRLLGVLLHEHDEDLARLGARWWSPAGPRAPAWRCASSAPLPPCRGQREKTVISALLPPSRRSAPSGSCTP